MKIPKSVWFVIFLIIAIPVVVWHTIDRMSYLESQTYMANMNPRRTKRFTIAVVGDELARDAHDNGFDHALERATGADVTSSGLSGETTKLLYRDLACDRFEWVIEGRPTYAVLLVGLHDQCEQFGPDQYAFHMRKIVDLLMYYDIRPVIVGIPPYDTEAYYQGKNVFQRLYYKYFCLVGTGTLRYDNRDIYKEILAPDTLPTMATYIDGEELGLQDSTCWVSPTALSRKGYANLANAIARRVKRRK